LLLNNFSDCRYAPQLRRYRPTKLCDGAQMTNFWRFLRPVFSASPVQHISDLHPKFALRPHHVWKTGSMVDIQSATAEIRRGKKEDRKKERRNHRTEIQWPALLHRAAIKIKCWKLRGHMPQCNIAGDVNADGSLRFKGSGRSIGH